MCSVALFAPYSLFQRLPFRHCACCLRRLRKSCSAALRAHSVDKFLGSRTGDGKLRFHTHPLNRLRQCPFQWQMKVRTRFAVNECREWSDAIVRFNVANVSIAELPICKQKSAFAGFFLKLSCQDRLIIRPHKQALAVVDPMRPKRIASPVHICSDCRYLRRQRGCR